MLERLRAPRVELWRGVIPLLKIATSNPALCGAISGIVEDALTSPSTCPQLSRVDRMVSVMIKKKQLDVRRIHHSPLFWVGAVLFLAAIAIYVFSDDLSWRPSAR